MIRTMLGRALAASTMLVAATAAQASGFTSAGGAASPNSNPIPYDSGLVYAFTGSVILSNTAQSAGPIKCSPVQFRDSTTIAELGTRVQAVSSTGGKMSLALYADILVAGVGHRPYGTSGPLAATGDIVTTNFTGGGVVAAAGGVAASSAVVTRNTRYWGCFWTDSNVNVATVNGGAGSALMGDPGYANFPGTNTQGYSVTQTVTYPTANTATSWPTTDGTGWTFSSGSVPLGLFKAL